MWSLHKWRTAGNSQEKPEAGEGRKWAQPDPRDPGVAVVSQSLSHQEAMGPSCHIPTLAVVSCKPTPRGWDGLRHLLGIQGDKACQPGWSCWEGAAVHRWQPRPQQPALGQVHPSALSSLHMQRAEGF